MSGTPSNSSNSGIRVSQETADKVNAQFALSISCINRTAPDEQKIYTLALKPQKSYFYDSDDYYALLRELSTDKLKLEVGVYSVHSDGKRLHGIKNISHAELPGKLKQLRDATGIELNNDKIIVGSGVNKADIIQRLSAPDVATTSSPSSQGRTSVHYGTVSTHDMLPALQIGGDTFDNIQFTDSVAAEFGVAQNQPKPKNKKQAFLNSVNDSIQAIAKELREDLNQSIKVKLAPNQEFTDKTAIKAFDVDGDNLIIGIAHLGGGLVYSRSALCKISGLKDKNKIPSPSPHEQKDDGRKYDLYKIPLTETTNILSRYRYKDFYRPESPTSPLGANLAKWTEDDQHIGYRPYERFELAKGEFPHPDKVYLNINTARLGDADYLAKLQRLGAEVKDGQLVNEVTPLHADLAYIAVSIDAFIQAVTPKQKATFNPRQTMDEALLRQYKDLLRQGDQNALRETLLKPAIKAVEQELPAYVPALEALPLIAEGKLRIEIIQDTYSLLTRQHYGSNFTPQQQAFALTFVIPSLIKNKEPNQAETAAYIAAMEPVIQRLKAAGINVTANDRQNYEQFKGARGTHFAVADVPFYFIQETLDKIKQALGKDSEKIVIEKKGSLNAFDLPRINKEAILKDTKVYYGRFEEWNNGQGSSVNRGIVIDLPILDDHRMPSDEIKRRFAELISDIYVPVKDEVKSIAEFAVLARPVGNSGWVSSVAIPTPNENMAKQVANLISEQLGIPYIEKDDVNRTAVQHPAFQTHEQPAFKATMRPPEGGAGPGVQR